MPTTLPRSSTSAPPELPGCTGTLIWYSSGSSCIPERLLISPRVNFGCQPCNMGSGKPMVNTGSPSFTLLLETKGNEANDPATLSKATSLT